MKIPRMISTLGIVSSMSSSRLDFEIVSHLPQYKLSSEIVSQIVICLNLNCKLFIWYGCTTFMNIVMLEWSYKLLDTF